MASTHIPLLEILSTDGVLCVLKRVAKYRLCPSGSWSVWQSGWDQEVDKRLVVMSTVDKVGVHLLVQPRDQFKRLYVVPFVDVKGYRYGDGCIRHAQEALCVECNSMTAIDDTIVFELVEKEQLPYVSVLG